jgi:hypothetical protein
VTAPLIGSETPEDDLPLCEDSGTACGGEVDDKTEETSVSSEQSPVETQTDDDDEVVAPAPKLMAKGPSLAK